MDIDALSNIAKRMASYYALLMNNNVPDGLARKLVRDMHWQLLENFYTNDDSDYQQMKRHLGEFD
jgi:hypothetical protein